MAIETLHNNYLVYLNRISTYGVTCLRALHNGKATYTRYRNDISDLVAHTGYPVNYFFTPNSLTKGKDGHYHARKINVSALRMIWFDFDLKNWIPAIKDDLRLCKRVKSDFYNNLLPRIIGEAALPHPSANDDSGYGFHLFYLFNNLIPLAKSGKKRTNLLAIYQKTVAAMVKRLNKACVNYLKVPLVDTNNSTNIAKLMRLPGSYNCKYGHKVLCKTISTSGITYSLDELYREYAQQETYHDYLKYRKQAQAKYDERGKQWKRENAKNKHFKQFKHNSKIVLHKCRYTLYMSRVRDILWLVKHRNGKMIKKEGNGYKKCYELTLFLYAINYVHLSNDKHISGYNLYQKLMKLNNLFKEPLQLQYIKKIVIEAHRPYFMDYAYPRHQHKEAHYLSNNWYISALGINQDEMKHMKVLINKQEKQRRYNTSYSHKIHLRKLKRRRLSKLLGAKHKCRKRNKKILDLHLIGLSYRKIARELSIGLSTVLRVMTSNTCNDK